MVAMSQFDPTTFLETLGYVGVTAIVFLKSGLLIGFLLPGDTLLFTAGFLASQGFFNIWVLCVLCTPAAITGNSVGYAIGQWLGPRLFNRENSAWFSKKHLERAHAFYERHGGKTILLARFIPVLRTFAPAVAGAASMRYASFMVFNILGGILWCVGLPWLGYLVGSTIPNADRYLLPIILLLVAVKCTLVAIARWRRKGRAISSPVGAGLEP